MPLVFAHEEYHELDFYRDDLYRLCGTGGDGHFLYYFRREYSDDRHCQERYQGGALWFCYRAPGVGGDQRDPYGFGGRRTRDGYGDIFLQDKRIVVYV